MPGGITVAIDQDYVGARCRRRSLTVAGAAQFDARSTPLFPVSPSTRVEPNRTEPKAGRV
ncbi:hypothetical protein SBBP2_20117 [Burkholderiales bacterium]|nr:hypothetical protein SBBP2_20117 [Burkholderiales bacterium]